MGIAGHVGLAGTGCVQLPGYVRPQSGWQFVVYSKYKPVSDRCSETPSPRLIGPDSASSWVEVHLDGAPSHYWNYKVGIPTKRLPPGQDAPFVAYKTSVDVDGGKTEARYFYLDKRTGQTTWTLPDMKRTSKDEVIQAASDSLCARWLEEGAAMVVTGLTNATRFNEQAVTVHCFQDGFVTVKLSDKLGGTVLGVRPQNLAPLSKGTPVEFSGLQNLALNGQIGTVETVDHQLCRYFIKTRDGGLKSVKGTKLLPRSRLWDLDLNSYSSQLQWRKEQSCLFIDSGGYHHRYHIHLPLTFQKRQQAAQQELKALPTWPLLVYLHGTGGTSFFTHSKKTLRSDGLSFAAENFVVLSPHCDWNWRERPKAWVNELIESLIAATFIDHTRVYLTGSSMGGMGAWEMSAEKPEIFAAVAPVAAHHQAQREDHIATRLLDVPIAVVHSLHDETCPAHLEHVLWDKLAAAGNEKLTVHLAPEIDHCSMYERAYCDDSFLYEWLLRFRKECKR